MIQVKNEDPDESQIDEIYEIRDSAEKALNKIESGEPLKQYVAVRYLAGTIDQGILDKLRPANADLLNRIEVTLKALVSGGEPALSREASIVLQKIDSYFGPSKILGPAPPQIAAPSCPGCNEAVHWSWCYCPECGYDLEVQHCGGCGVQIERQWSFCPVCGRTLSL